MSDPIADLAAWAGIVPTYKDQTGLVHETGRDTQRALLAAMGLGVESERQASGLLADLKARRKGILPPWIVTDTERTTTLPTVAEWSVSLEAGSEIEGRGRHLPPIPIGIHVLTVKGETSTLLSAPASLPRPDRCWGTTAPLWGLRGPERKGFGDFEDLRTLGHAVAGHGAAFVGINPIHTGFPSDATACSPYSPSHRRRLNALHVAVPSGESAGPLVNYGREIPAKRAALRGAYRSFCHEVDQTAFEAFLKAEGESLHRFALHQALSDLHGPLWTDWPADLQRPETVSARDMHEEVRFHGWLQWMAETQLREVNQSLLDAGMRFGLYLDLAVGTHPAGAETWTDRGAFAPGVSLGAPGDDFAPEGQTWQLAPFDPHALVRGRFQIFAETLSKQLAFSKLLRIDHILGFDRAFWVPETRGIAGAYVRMPLKALLAVTRIEAARAGAAIVGEDLGNIPAGLQDALIGSGILGCRVMQFERDSKGFKAPSSYPEQTLASFGTHDLPTWKGWKSGADITARHAISPMDDKTAARAMADRKTTLAQFVKDAGAETSDSMHAALAAARSALVTVQLEDVLDVEEQTNLPGTISEYPNWRRTLPVDVLEIGTDRRLAQVAGIMSKAGR